MTRRFCDWAGCRNPASSYVDNFHHCRPHLAEHHRLMAEQDRILAEPLRFRPRKDRASAVTCGTRSGFSRHRLLGEDPCARCRAVEQEYQRIRHQRRRATDTDRAASGKPLPGRDNSPAPSRPDVEDSA